MKFKIINEMPVSMFEAKEELAKIKVRDKELSFRAQKAADYFDQIVQFSSKECKELVTRVTKLDVPRLKEQHVHKLVDILPLTSKDVKTTLQGYAVTITNENLKKIADTIAELVQKK